MSPPSPTRTRRWLLLLGVVTVISVPAYIEFFLRRPVGEGPAGPAVPATAFEHTWSDRQVVLVGLGDSVTRGLGAKSTTHHPLISPNFVTDRGRIVEQILVG